MADANYENVVLLLHANGANGSKGIRDERGHAFTCNGSAALSTTQSKFGGSSIAIATDTANKITTTASSDWAFGTGDFTFECWLYLTAYNSAGGRIVAAGGGTVGFNSTAGIHWLFQSTVNGVIFSYWDGGTSSTGPSTTVALNTWTHIAVTRASGTMRLFKDGILNSTVTNASGSPSTTPSLNIGCVPGEGSGSAQAFHGYLDEIRITKGLARYTANFTAPTAAFDHTTNSSIDPYFNNVVLQCHFDGVNASTPPYSDLKNHAVTWSGNAALSTTQSKFGGSSLALDGTLDYLSVANSSDWDFGTGDFTIEAWVYILANSAVDGSSTRTAVIASSASDSNPNTYWAFNIRGDGTTTGTGLILETKLSGTITASAINATISQNAWHHVAVSKSGSSVYFSIDGVVTTGSTISSAISHGTGAVTIGGELLTSWPRYLNGYIDELRITAGVARYTVNFTPPIAAFPDAVDDSADPFYSSVTLLQHMDDVALSDVKGHTVSLSGNVARSAVQSKFGGFSAVFDGNGDFLTIPDSNDWDFGTGDFTVELWYRFANTSADQTFVGNYLNSTTGWTFQYRVATNRLVFANGDTLIASPAWIPTVNEWYHLAVCRINGNLRLFVNGIQLGSTVANSTNISGATISLFVGKISAAVNYYCNGYMDDLRITTGKGRYLAQFQPPTQAFYGILGFFDSLYLSQQYTITTPDKDSYFTNQQYSITAPEKDSYFTNQQYSVSAPVTDRLNVEQRYAVDAPIRDGLYTNQQYAIQQPIRDSHYLNQQWGTNVVLITYVTLDSSVNVGSDLTGIKAVLTTLDSNLNVLSIGSFVFTLPVTLISNLSVQTTISVKQIIGVLLNSILYAQPLLSARYTAKATLIETANTWVLNLETNATSQYDNFGFNSFATTPDGRQLACAEDGIYSINQSVNPTDIVPTLVQFPKTNFGTSAATNVHEVWLGVASHDKLVIKTITEQGTFYYTARTNTDTVDVTRVDLGKGVRSNYWDISLIGSTDLELETIEFFPISTSRRI